MKRDDKKTDRTRIYLAETAMKMIRERGIESVSVRKVAEQAGYALGTIYNNFKNLDELLWLTRSLLIQDMGEKLQYGMANPPQSLEQVISLFQGYAQYYMKNPHIYRFFYFKSLNREFKADQNLTESQDFTAHMGNTLMFLVEEGKIIPQQIPPLLKTIILSIHGLLTLALGDNDEISPHEIPGEVETLIRQLLGNV